MDPYPVPTATVEPYPVPTSDVTYVGVDGGPLYQTLDRAQPIGGGLLLATGGVVTVWLLIQRLGLRLR